MNAENKESLLERKIPMNELRNIPSVSSLIEEAQKDNRWNIYTSKYSESWIKHVLKQFVHQRREHYQESHLALPNSMAAWTIEYYHYLDIQIKTQKYHRIINATGIIIHTNLGRSPLHSQGLQKVETGYMNLELDCLSGKRGSRAKSLEEMLSLICKSEDAVIVNNNAASVVLSVSALAKGKEVIISRGELIEIGGAFRIPDMIEAAGAKLKEVGTTNRTHIKDYQNAINDNTAVIMKIHRSNFEQTGFVHEVSLEELSVFSEKAEIPLLYDAGSGLIFEYEPFLKHGEITVKQALAKKSDVIMFSGDKLFGGPQAGIIVGKTTIIQKLKKHPFYRAFRCDKVTLQLLEQVCIEYLRSLDDFTKADIPIWKMITRSENDLLNVCNSMKEKIFWFRVIIQNHPAKIGGGALPEFEIPTPSLFLSHPNVSSQTIKDFLLQAQTPILASIENDKVIINPRTLFEEDGSLIIDTLRTLAAAHT